MVQKVTSCLLLVKKFGRLFCVEKKSEREFLKIDRFRSK